MASSQGDVAEHNAASCIVPSVTMRDVASYYESVLLKIYISGKKITLRIGKVLDPVLRGTVTLRGGPPNSIKLSEHRILRVKEHLHLHLAQMTRELTYTPKALGLLPGLALPLLFPPFLKLIIIITFFFTGSTSTTHIVMAVENNQHLNHAYCHGG